MKRKYELVLAAALAACMTFTVPVAAQQIVFKGEACPLPMSELAWGEPQVKEVSKLDVIGIRNERVAALVKTAEESAGEQEDNILYAAIAEVMQQAAVDQNGESSDQDWRMSYILMDDFTSMIPNYDITTLPLAEDYPDLVIGSSGETVLKLQEDLILLGYLSGSADGDYGIGTQTGVQQFQLAYGLETSGNADAVTQWAAAELALIKSGQAEKALKFTYPPVSTVEEKFAQIFEQTDADLTPFLSPEWKFSYDLFEGAGYIRRTEEVDLGTVSQQEKSIDRLQLRAYPCVAVLRNEDGRVDLIPSVHVSTSGAYCPYIQNIQINAGGELIQIDLLGSTRGLSGADVTEDDDMTLTEEALEFLETSKGPFTFRFNGTARSYDLDVSAKQLRSFIKDVKGLV